MYAARVQPENLTLTAPVGEGCVGLNAWQRATLGNVINSDSVPVQPADAPRNGYAFNITIDVLSKKARVSVKEDEVVADLITRFANKPLNQGQTFGATLCGFQFKLLVTKVMVYNDDQDSKEEILSATSGLIHEHKKKSLNPKITFEPIESRYLQWEKSEKKSGITLGIKSLL